MSRERASVILWRNFNSWAVGITKSTTEIFQEYPEVRRNLNQQDIINSMEHMDCYNITKSPDSRSLNQYTRTSLPGDVCQECFFNTKSSYRKVHRQKCKWLSEN